MRDAVRPFFESAEEMMFEISKNDDIRKIIENGCYDDLNNLNTSS